MTQPLLHKIAYVTGGSRGIGRASALALADAGADIAICHLDDEVEARTLVQAVTARGRRGFQMAADMGDLAQVNAFAAAADAAVGPCDILLNNAGMNIRSAFGTITEADYDRMLDVHLNGHRYLLHGQGRHHRLHPRAGARGGTAGRASQRRRPRPGRDGPDAPARAGMEG